MSNEALHFTIDTGAVTSKYYPYLISSVSVTKLRAFVNAVYTRPLCDICTCICDDGDNLWVTRVNGLVLCFSRRLLHHFTYIYEAQETEIKCFLSFVPDMPTDREQETSATPLTVKQIVRASQDHSDALWTLDGRELGLVRCIGNVATIDKRENYGLLKFEDGTAGAITIHIFKRKEYGLWDAFTMSIATKQIKEMAYVCVTGWVHGNKGYRNALRAKNIVPVEDPHQTYFHILECIHLQEKQKEELDEESSEEPPAEAEQSKVEMEKDDRGHEGGSTTETPGADLFGESSDEEVEYADEEEPPESTSEFDIAEAEQNQSESEEEEEERGKASVDEAEVDQTVAIKTETSIVKAEAHVKFAVPISESKAKAEDEGGREVTMAPESDNIVSTSHNKSNKSNKKPQSSRHPSPDPLSGLGTLHRALILHIQRRRDEIWAEGEQWEGLHISELTRLLKRKKKDIDKSEISAIFDDLIEDGQIFTTVHGSFYDTI